MIKKILLILSSLLVIFSLASCGTSETGDLTVFNVGEYIDPDLISKFEEEYKCKVNYVTFDSNEAAITKMESESFDIVVPSEYAVEQLIKDGKLQKLDWSKINITKDDLSQDLVFLLDKLKNENEGYDLLEYAMPYFFGNVGIVYDRNKVSDEEIEELGWTIFKDSKYMNKTAYYDSSRDGFMVALKALGYSMNTLDEKELEEAFNWILDVKQKTNSAFKTDELLSEMPDGKYAISLMYSGDAIYAIQEENENVDLAFYVPPTGTNVYVDSMVIPKNAKNTEMAYNFINFMCEYDNALANTEYVGYSSCIEEVYNDVIKEDGEFYDFKDYYKVTYSLNDEFFRYNPELKYILNEYWVKLKLS